MKSGPLKEYNGFICDLTDRAADLARLLSDKLFDPALLDGPTKPVLPVNMWAVAPRGLAAAMDNRRAALGYDAD
jgi:hypothetical protein